MEFDVKAGIVVLERTPRAMSELLAGLAPAWTDATEGPETWSPYDIVGHLIHGERTDWIPRAQIIRATQYREAVGPWRAYLSVLDR